MTDNRENASDDNDLTRSLENENVSGPFDQEANFELETGSFEASHSSSPVQRIGPYKLLQQIGEGGMGSVWLAEQDKPVRRRVAVKLIKGAMADKQIIARFEAERQALAMMDHQNIATVLDAGTTDTGNPYFVMELVNGIPINQYCDRNKLNPDQRLRLFVQVCKAIQHAHQKGIIHRDLKPSNVLVQLHDGEPIAKVIDFGLAKALQHQTKLTDKTLYTEFGQVVGTLQYMSPEQATMDAMNVDTRTDIYSLGVMLYELLAGSTPVDKETLKNNALLHVLELIREKEPPKPSLRLSSTREKLPAISEQRQIQPGKLQQILRGELDWIVMKALEKDRTRRYESASDFAQDINNYLSGDAVDARPPSTWYQLQKFSRKNKGLVASLATISLLLLAASGISSWFAFQANNARKEETTQREIAENKTKEVSKERDRANENEALANEEAKRARDSDAAGKFQLAIARADANRASEARSLLEGIPQEYRKFEWHFSKRNFLGSDLTCYGHRLPISSVAYSPDGRWIVSGSSDRTIKLWDAVSGAELRTLSGHLDQVFSVAFSPDGQQIVSGSNDYSIKLWDVEKGVELRTLHGHAGVVTSVAFSPNGKRIVSGSADGTVKLWDTAKGTELQSLGGQTGGISRVVFSPDGRWVASGGMDSTVRLWDTASGAELKSFSGHINPISSVAFSPDGQWIASGSLDGTVKLWDTVSGAELRTLVGHTRVVNSVAFSPDGRRIGSGSFDETVKLWDAASGAALQTFSGHTAGVESVAFSPDGQRIVSGSKDKTIKVWDAANGTKQQTIRGHTDSITNVVFSPDGQRIASGTWSGTIKLWDASSGLELQTLSGHAGPVHCIVFSPDGQRIASGGGDSRIRLWDASNGVELQTLSGHLDEVVSVVFSPDGKRIASGSNDYTIKIWDAASGDDLKTLGGHAGPTSSVVFSPDGQQIASGSYDRTIKLWDASTGTELQTLRGHRNAVESVVFLTGQRIASSSADSSIKYWDAVSGTELQSFKASAKSGIVFSPDGQRIASGDDYLVKLWDAKSGNELQALRGHAGSVRSVAFSPDGQWIASGGLDNTIKLWDGSSAAELRKFSGHTGDVIHMYFSSDGQRVYSIGENEKLVWDAKTGTVDSEASWVDSDSNQRKSPDGRWLLTSEGSNIVLIDLMHKSMPREKAYRAAKARFDPWWQRKQAEKSVAEKNWYAATFHYALLLKNDPDQAESYDNFHDALQELKSGMSSAKIDVNVRDLLPLAIKDVLKLSRGNKTSRISDARAREINESVWEKVKTRASFEQDPLLERELFQCRELVAQQPRGFYFNTLAIAEFRTQNYKEAIAAAFKSVELLPKEDETIDSPYPSDFAILAMSHFKLREMGKANEYRSKFNQAMTLEVFKVDEDCLAFVNELEDCFSAEITPND